MFKHLFLAGSVLAAPLAATEATAQDSYAAEAYGQIINAYFTTDIGPWISAPEILSAIRVKNEMNKSLSADDILAQDKVWRAEAESASHPLIDSIVDTDTSDFLRKHVVMAGGVITEIIVMDAKGLNVAASAATSDYWQGDEAKHIETFGAGAGSIHISEMEIDASTGAYQVQVSSTVVDPLSGEAIGAITVGLIADSIL